MDSERFFIPSRGGLVVRAGMSDAAQASDAMGLAASISDPAKDLERFFIPGHGGLVIRMYKCNFAQLRNTARHKHQKVIIKSGGCGVLQNHSRVHPGMFDKFCPSRSCFN